MSLGDDPEYKKLKETHKMFLTNILSGKSATESYALAFPKAGRKTAASKGYKLKQDYADMLQRHAPINPDKIEKISNQTLHNLTLMAFADMGDMIGADGKPKNLHDMPKPLRMAVTEVEVEGERIKYKIGGKTKALEILSKIVKLHNDQPEINVSIITEEERESRLKEIVVRAMSRNGDTGDSEDEG